MGLTAFVAAVLFSLLTLGCASVAPPPPKIESSAAPVPKGAARSVIAPTTATITLWPLEALPTVAISSVSDCSNSAVNTASCKIRIKVTNKEADNCTIELVQPIDDLISIGQVPAGTIIYWAIDDVAEQDSYIFTRSDGVTFLDNFGKKNRAFFNGQRADDDPKVFQWEKRNRGRRVFAYVINVRNTAATRDCSLDPWIRNIA